MLNELDSSMLTDEGLECQYLSPKGGGWKKGRFRVMIEFIPDAPEHPLDDIRSSL
ncbi:hypothetical protein K4A83_12710 [Spirulina subsalsa FACHB-351]|uniref:KGK domain-containing protein n=1 Tax=Spirulina subsalsa FACHB-351 TaxID=234711 RepID=A0ABT3L6J1_9CYAN|nr:hypothetical protein [Spirulina subsalsa FACHB-351]